MSKQRKKKEFNALDPDTIIEVVAIKGDKVFKDKIKISERSTHKRAKGWSYLYYQVGYCSIKEKK